MMETKADTNNLIARTGRVQNWIDDPHQSVARVVHGHRSFRCND